MGGVAEKGGLGGGGGGGRRVRELGNKANKSWRRKS